MTKAATAFTECAVWDGESPFPAASMVIYAGMQAGSEATDSPQIDISDQSAEDWRVWDCAQSTNKRLYNVPD